MSFCFRMLIQYFSIALFFLFFSSPKQMDMIFSSLTDVINRNGGDVVKLAGDLIICLVLALDPFFSLE